MDNIIMNTLFQVENNNPLRKLIGGCDLLIYGNPLDDMANGYNFVKCDSDGTLNPNGLYIRLESSYQEIIDSDTTNILTNPDTTNKVLLIADLYNVNENKLFVEFDGAGFQDGDIKRILYFNSPLTGTCLINVNSILGFNEIVTDDTGSILVTSDTTPLYTYKTGISLKTDERVGVTG